MRSILLVQLLAVLAVVLGNPTPTKPVSARQMTRKELVARAKYPELFGRRARIVGRVAPENQVQVIDDPDDDGDALLPVIIEDDPPEPLTTQAPIDCPSRKRQRRDLQDKFETPLSAREMAAFILGRGEFTWDNGTVYRDEADIEILAKAASNYNSWYRRSFTTVHDANGSAYMEATVPAVKRFFRYWGDGELVWLSDNTAIRGGDLPKIGPILLESPEFQSIQVHGWTLSRKLVEILQSV